MTQTRDEYLTQAKARALKYLDRGDISSALASMGKDMDEHPEFRGIAAQLMPLALIHITTGDIVGARRWIEGFR